MSYVDDFTKKMEMYNSIIKDIDAGDLCKVVACIKIARLYLKERQSNYDARIAIEKTESYKITDPVLYELIGEIYSDLKDYKNAITNYEESLKLNKNFFYPRSSDIFKHAKKNNHWSKIERFHVRNKYHDDRRITDYSNEYTTRDENTFKFV